MQAVKDREEEESQLGSSSIAKKRLGKMDIFELEKVARERNVRSQARISHKNLRTLPSVSEDQDKSQNSMHSRRSFFRKKPNQIDPMAIYDNII